MNPAGLATPDPNGTRQAAAEPSGTQQATLGLTGTQQAAPGLSGTRQAAPALIGTQQAAPALIGTQQAAPALIGTQQAAYAALALPLAFAALPLYVHLAPVYGERLSLTLLGGLLLALRVFDAVIDPLLGALYDRFPRPRLLVALALPLLGVGWVGVFSPPQDGVAVWLAATLALTTLGYSLAGVAHNAWGATLAPGPEASTRLFAWREGAGLVGVLLAAALPYLLAPTLEAGIARQSWLFLLLLAGFGAWTLLGTPVPPASTAGPRRAPLYDWLRPLADPAFSRLLVGYLINAVAASLPATLVIFFVADVLDLARWSGAFLGLYFIAGAAGMPLWVALARRVGKLDAWLASMALAVASFVAAFFLGAGDAAGFALVCAASGLALGADLALPPALVADLLARRHADAALSGVNPAGAGASRSYAGASRSYAGASYGLLGFCSKLAMALAAGLALPLLDAAGYRPGGGAALPALSFAYALLPCAIKLVAIAWFWRARPQWRWSPC